MSMITLLQADQRLRTEPKYTGELMEKLLLAFGGSEFFFGTDEKIAFLLDLSLPAENDRGVNFDIRLAYSLVTLFRRYRSDQIHFYYRPLPGFTAAQTLEQSGYQSLAALDNVVLHDLREESAVRRSCGTYLTGEQIEVYSPLAQADVVISLVKYKAAQGSLFGSALRSLANCSPQPLDEDFADRLLVDIYSVITPDLFIIDGMIGNGGFQPQAKDCLLAAADAVAADSVLATLARIPAADVNSLCLAAQYGLGNGDPGGIALYGDDLAQLMK